METTYTKKNNSSSLLGLLNGAGTIAIVVILIVVAVTAMTNGDLLWFLKSFNAQAEAFTIYWEGATFTVTPEDAGYAEMMAAFAQGIEKPVAFEWNIAFSHENITRYREEFKMLEIVFAEPVQVHTRHPFPEAKTYLIPLDKTHAQWHRIFAFTGITNYSSGPLEMSTEHFDALYTAVEGAVAAQQ